MPPVAESTDSPWAAVALARWEPPHPVTAALLDGLLPWPEPVPKTPPPRSRELASALEKLNARWGNPVEASLAAWLAGAQAVVTGQQPGVWGGPLLSLVKACAVAAEVARLRQAGQAAVGFFWMETRDDDLPEMGWGRVVVGGQLYEVREAWARGQACGFAARLSERGQEVLDSIPQEALPPGGREAWAWARECFAPGSLLGEACGRFLGGLLAGTGVVLVDASLPEVARAAAEATRELVARTGEAVQRLERRARELENQGLAPPLQVRVDRLPFFRLVNGTRRPVTVEGVASLLEHLGRHPEGVTPNVWARPLLQDAVLGTSVAVLGSAELAYHWQAQDLWDVVGIPRPRWVLRPHVTVVGPAERRWAQKLGLDPEELLTARLPRRLGGPSRLEWRFGRLSERVLADFQRFSRKASLELPNLAADLLASEQRLASSLAWLAERLRTRAGERFTVTRQRFDSLRRALRPAGKAQERAVSVLSPLLALGRGFPRTLGQALATLPRVSDRMYLLFWRPGGFW